MPLRGRPGALVIHSEGDILDLLTRVFEGAGFDVQTAVSAFRAQAQLQGARRVDVVIVPWDTSHTLGGELYRWVLGHLPELRNRFVFIADDIPPEFDAVVGGRCLTVPLAGLDELVRVAQAIVRRVRTPPRGIPVVVDKPALLLVDDDPALLAAMAELLSESGYAVFEAGGGRAAQEALGERDFAAIVTDWRMHDGSGAALYRWILEERPHLASRVVFLTETAEDDSGSVALERPRFRKGQDSQGLLEVLRELVTSAG